MFRYTLREDDLEAVRIYESEHHRDYSDNGQGGEKQISDEMMGKCAEIVAYEYLRTIGFVDPLFFPRNFLELPLRDRGWAPDILVGELPFSVKSVSSRAPYISWIYQRDSNGRWDPSPEDPKFRHILVIMDPRCRWGDVAAMVPSHILREIFRDPYLPQYREVKRAVYFGDIPKEFRV
jgi:hypothetical protein